MARGARALLAVTLLAVTVAADKGAAVHHHPYGYRPISYDYKPFSYSYGVHEPYRQNTNVHHYQHGLGYGYPYGYGHRYGHPYNYGLGYGYGYGLPAYSHVKYSGYPTGYALQVAHSKVHPNKYANSHAYAHKPAEFGYSSTVVHPAGAVVAVLRPVGGYGKLKVLHGKAAEEKPGKTESAAAADDESASGEGMIDEDVIV
ncbi:prisilkin-39-like [Amphibalanus amphitrite]|nr:prisilkin-39-like [Amphibalanus amphitrite]